jgi:hypothetical protein
MGFVGWVELRVFEQGILLAPLGLMTCAVLLFLIKIENASRLDEVGRHVGWVVRDAVINLRLVHRCGRMHEGLLLVEGLQGLRRSNHAWEAGQISGGLLKFLIHLIIASASRVSWLQLFGSLSFWRKLAARTSSKLLRTFLCLFLE